MNKKLKDAALEIWKSWEGKNTLTTLGNLTPDSRKDAYKVQAYLQELYGDDLFGWKIAATSRLGQKHIGVNEPLAGRIFQKKVLSNHSHVSLKNNLMLVAEAEFGFEIAEDIPVRKSKYENAEILSFLKSAYAVIEVPNSRFKNYSQIGDISLIADNACANYLIIGEKMPDNWKEKSLADLDVTITCLEENKKILGKGRNVLGSPINAMTWLVNELSKNNISISKGQIISTGTCVTPLEIKNNSIVKAQIGDYAQATARFS